MSLLALRPVWHAYPARLSLAGAACSVAALAVGIAHATPEKSQPAATANAAAEASPPATVTPRLTLTVAPAAPLGPWTLEVENPSEAAVQLRGDIRLLSLELTPAPSETPVPSAHRVTSKLPAPIRSIRCTLPLDTRPNVALVNEYILEPTERWSTSFDPLFFCFAADARRALVAGTQVKALLGWPPPPSPATASRMPVKVTRKVSLEPPFIVTGIPGHAKELPGIKVLESETLVLPKEEPPSLDEVSENASEDTPEVSAPDSEPEEPTTVWLSTPPALDLARGHEVETEVALRNDGERPLAVWMRPDMIHVEVASPSGTTSCAAPRTKRTPIPELVIDVPSKGSTSTSLLLSALCPMGTFDAPGVYRIYMRLDTTEVKSDFLDRELWTGVAKTKEPLLLRVRLPRQAAVEPEATADD